MIKEVMSLGSGPFSKRIEYIEDNTVLAFLDYSLIYDRIEIDNIEVLKEYRNQGIGTRLIDYIIRIAIKNNLVNITLEVRKSNYIAQKLYHKMGFKEVAIRKYYYGDEDALLMEKKVM